MELKFFIIVPFLNDFEPSSGTTIRIAGYTRSLEELGVDYRFLSTRKPDYVPHNKHELLTMSRKWIKIILLHNLFYSHSWLRPFSVLLRIIINHFSGIREISEKIEDRIIWSHQENVLAFYLYFIQHKTFIYDIHGFFSIQREYRNSLNFWRKLWFDLYLKHERIVIKKAPYVNVVSRQMGKYVIDTFMPSGKILLAPDGIPADLESYKNAHPLKEGFGLIKHIPDDKKIILFAGSFKKIGGVTELVRIFIKDQELYTKAFLVLIGNGQEERAVYKLLDSCSCADKIVHLNSMPHSELIPIFNSADVIVCPDLKNNQYNEMTPHIKLFDAVATGKQIVATDFEVNREIFPEAEFNIFYFSYNGINSLNKILHKALDEPDKKYNEQNLKELTYLYHTKNYLEYFN